MNIGVVEKIANAVLYEGYILYPYRPSAVKNQQRFNFGVLYPREYCDLQAGSEPGRCRPNAWCGQRSAPRSKSRCDSCNWSTRQDWQEGRGAGRLARRLALWSRLRAQPLRQRFAFDAPTRHARRRIGTRRDRSSDEHLFKVTLIDPEPARRWRCERHEPGRGAAAIPGLGSQHSARQRAASLSPCSIRRSSCKSRGGRMPQHRHLAGAGGRRRAARY